jgi:hypothetical protein
MVPNATDPKTVALKPAMIRALLAKGELHFSWIESNRATPLEKTESMHIGVYLIRNDKILIYQRTINFI